MKVNFKGGYVYNYPLEGEGEVLFQIVADYVGEGFEGRLADEEFTALTGDDTAVKGMINDKRISFTQTYPYQYDELEDGTLFIDAKAVGHQVYYEGIFNEKKNRWEGTWEILAKEEETDFYEGEELDSGTWHMKRVTSAE